MPRSPASSRLAQSKRERYLNTGQASRALEGLLSPGQLRQMALNGEIPGALRVRSRVLIPRVGLDKLVVELEFNAQPRQLHRPPANTFDARSAV